MTLRPAIVVVALSSLLLSGCFLSPEPEASESGAVPGPVISNTAEPGQPAVYGQTVEWTACGDLDCATVDVPLDWQDPDGETIQVAINRHPAGDQSAKVGSLLINPGGPGASGLSLTESFAAMAGKDLIEAYDIIGFDPRGIGESTPMICGDSAFVDAQYIEDRILETQADIDDSIARTVDFTAQCREDSGAVVEFMDTASAARDMDVIRAVLGDDKLHYLGFSYGTQLGAVYAELYPDTVGRVVLDGAVDFLLPSEELSAGQAKGFENALANYIDWCHGESDCPLVDDPAEAKQQVHDITIQARDEGYPASGANDVNGNLMVYGIVVTMYDEGSWPYLSLALDETINSGTASIFAELANFYLDRDPRSGEYLGNSTIAFTGVNCLDATDASPATLEDLNEFKARMEADSPTLGWWFASSTGCGGWPWTAAEKVTSLDAAADGGPILVIGTTNDPATPYEWAQSLADRLGAPMLTYDGEGHTAYGRSNDCVIDVVDSFLVGGELPEDGVQC